MATLVLRLAGPMQAWGASSRFTVRSTRRAPTKSGLIGLIAAAQGRQRNDSIEDLMGLNVAVRIDQPGSLLQDFQTAKNEKGEAMPLSNRYYLTDAVFVAGIEGSKESLETIRHSLESPSYPLYLGRRSCPPSLPLVLNLVDESLEDALSAAVTPWQASSWFQRRIGNRSFDAELLSDHPLCKDNAQDALEETVSDVPISFAMENRRYSWRTVYRSRTCLKKAVPLEQHDPLAFLEDV